MLAAVSSCRSCWLFLVFWACPAASLVTIRTASREQVRSTLKSVSILADAKSNGENVGMCALELLDCGGSEPQCLMSGLLVQPGWRRQGIARKLVATCEEQTRKWGYSELLLNVQQSNTAAYTLYSDMGYRRVLTQGEDDAVAGVFGWLLRSQRQLWMRKEL